MRNSRIELLRIISMLMIVLSHYTVHNGVINWELSLGINRFLLEATKLGDLGVIIFILITGYFSFQKNNPFKIKKCFLLIAETFFYSIVIYIIFVSLKITNFSIKTFFLNAFPITYKAYWFMSAFIIIYIFSPYINKFLNSMSRQCYINYMFTSIFIFSILTTLTNKNYCSNEIMQFLIYYSIGGYLYKYKNNFFSKKKNRYTCLIFSIFILLFSVFIFDIIGTKYLFFAKKANYLFSRSSFINILLAISIFSCFINKPSFNNKIINKISTSVLAVYLISDNFYIRKILWKDILKIYNYVNSPVLILHMLMSIMTIFIICIIIDEIRKQTVEKIVIRVYDDSLDKFKKIIKIYKVVSIKLYNKINQ